MKFLVINLPDKRKIIRKYACSYYAAGVMYPVLELIRVASILKKNVQETSHIVYVDAIAEQITEKKCAEKIVAFEPDVIITMLSVDFINNETSYLKKIRAVSGAKVIAISYIADLYREHFSYLDVVLGKNFEQVLHTVSSSKDIANASEFINSLNDYVHAQMPFNPDLISLIDYSFIKPKLYYEFHVKGLTAFIYFSFGCPYQCSFCLKTYNLEKMYVRRYDDIVAELYYLYKLGYKNIRILDDNCTAYLQLLKDINKELGKSGIKFNFYGLTRLDLINEHIINELACLGFKRLYLGLETVSAEKQLAYAKNLDLDKHHTSQKIKTLAKSGVECTMFFLFNPMEDTKKDVKNILKYLRPLPVTYANLSLLVPYPGTPLFDRYRNQIDFHVTPNYICRFKTVNVREEKKLIRYFLFSFYLSNFKRFLLVSFRFFWFFSKSLNLAGNFMRFLFSKNNERDDFI